MKNKANSYHSQVNREKSDLKEMTSDPTRASEQFLKFLQHINLDTVNSLLSTPQTWIKAYD